MADQCYIVRVSLLHSWKRALSQKSTWFWLDTGACILPQYLAGKKIYQFVTKLKVNTIIVVKGRKSPEEMFWMPLNYRCSSVLKSWSNQSPSALQSAYDGVSCCLGQMGAMLFLLLAPSSFNSSKEQRLPPLPASGRFDAAVSRFGDGERASRGRNPMCSALRNGCYFRPPNGSQRTMAAATFTDLVFK